MQCGDQRRTGFYVWKTPSMSYVNFMKKHAVYDVKDKIFLVRLYVADALVEKQWILNDLNWCYNLKWIKNGSHIMQQSDVL